MTAQHPHGMNPVRGTFSLVWMLLSFLVVSVKVSAANYSDTHGDNALTGWTSFGTRTWTETGGYMVPQDVNGNTGLLINDNACNPDGTFNFTLKVTSAYQSKMGGGIFRFIDATHFYFVRLEEGDTSMAAAANAMYMCTNTVASTGCTLVKSNINLSGLGASYPIRVVAQGSNFSFYLNGVFLATLTDATNATGKVGYGYTTQWNQYVKFDQSDWTDAVSVAPTVSSLFPADNSIQVSYGRQPFRMQFDQAVQAGTGNIYLKKTSDNSIVETFSVASNQVSFGGSSLMHGFESGVEEWGSWGAATRSQDNTRAHTGTYSLKAVTSGTWSQVEGRYGTQFQDWSGYDSVICWVYTATAGATVKPFVRSGSSDTWTDLSAGTSLTQNAWTRVAAPLSGIPNPTRVQSYGLNFSAAATYWVDDVGLEKYGSTYVTFTPSANLALDNGYYVTVDGTAIKNSSNQNYAGISNGTTWNFTTNQSPTNISLSSSTVAENLASGATVGTLSGTDPDGAETFSYSLVSGTGSTDNASFTISGSSLLTAATFDYETKSSYSIRVEVNDSRGSTYQKALTISVSDASDRLVWDNSTTAGTQTGSGTWGTNSYWSYNGTDLFAWPGSAHAAEFAGANGTYTITLNGAQSADSVIFTNTGYTLTGGTVTMTGSAPAIVSTVNGAIASTISGAFSKTGAGTLTLSADNSTAGGPYTHLAGTTSVSNAKALGAGTATMNGSGQILLGNGLVVATPFTVTSCSPGSGNGAFTVASGSSATLSGAITLNASCATGGTFAGSSDLTGILTLQGAIGGSNQIGQRDGIVVYKGGGTSTKFRLMAGTGRLGAINGIPTTAFLSFGTSGAATFDLYGFNQTLTGIGGTTNSPTETVTNSQAAATLTLNGTSDTAFPGAITGAISLVKAGSYEQILSGTNTYTGTTTINAGRLTVTGSTAAASAVTVNSGGTLAGTGTVSGAITVSAGTLAPGLSASRGILNGASANLSSGTGSALTIRGAAYTTAGTDFDKLNLTGALTLGGSSVLNLDLTGLTGTGTMTGIVQATGGVSGTFATINVLNYTGTNSVKVVYNANSIDVVVGSASFTWTGTTSTDWGNGANWSPAGVPGADGSVTVNKAGGATVALNGNRNVLNITLGNAGTDVMTIQQGTSGTLTIASGGAVGTHASSTSAQVISCPVALSASMTTTVNNASGTLDYQGAVSGAFALVKAGSGTMKLSGTNTYSGATTVNAGTLKLGSTSALGSSNGVTVASGAALDFNGITYATSIPLSLNGTGISSSGALMNSSSTGATYPGLITLAGATTINGGTGTIAISNAGTITGNTYGLTLGGAAGGTLTSIVGTGTGTLSKQDAGTWTISGNNTYSGGFTLAAGSVVLGHSNALGSGAATANGSGQIFLNNGINIANTITVSACNAGVGNSVISSASGANATWSGSININATCAYGGHLGGASDLTGSLTVSGPITMGGSATWVQQRDGIVIYSGGGTATRFDALKGTARLGATNGLPSTARFSQSHTGYASTLDLYGYNQTFQGIASATNALNIVTNSQVGLSTLTLSGSVDTIYQGGITGYVALVKSGTYVQTLSGANSYTGSTTISAGTIKLGVANAIPSTSAVTVTGILDMNTYSDAIGSLAGAGTVDNVSGAGTPTLTVGADNSNTTFSGAIQNTSGTLALTKSGSAAFTLSGTNTYTGATSVSAGTLLVTGSLASGSAVTVASGATLSGNGTVAGTVSVQSGATLAPGSATGVSIATLNTGALTFASGSTYSVDLNGTTPTFDKVNVTGTVTLGNATLTVANIANAAASKTYTIVSATSVSGTFNGLANGSTFVQQTRTFQITYTSTTVTLTDITGIAIGTKTWTGAGSDNNWSTPANWGGTAPLPGDNLVFAGSTRLTPNNDYGAGTSFGSITFNSGSGNFVVGGNALTLTGGATAIVSNAASGTMTVNNNLTFSTSAPTITSATGGTLTVGGTVANGGLLLTTSASGTINLNAALSGTGGLTKSGTGTMSLSGTNTYSGATNVNAGILQLGGTSALGSSSGVTVASGAGMDLNGVTYVTSISLSLNGTGISGGGALLNSSSSTATYPGLISLAGAASIIGGAGAINISNTGTISGSGNGLTLGGAVGGTLTSILGTGAGTLTTQDAGSWTISGANTFTGLTTVGTGSTLKLNNAAALGNVSGGTVVASGAILDLNGINYSNAEPLTLNGTGISSSGVLKNQSASAATFAGLITLGSDVKIAANSGTISLTNTGTITGAGYTLTLSGSNGGTCASVIGVGTGGFTKNGAGTWTLTGVSTYSGATTILQGTLKLGVANAIPSGSALTATGTLDMNTFSDAIGSLAGAGTVDNVSGAGTPTLTVGADNSTTAFSGVLQNTTGVLALVKTGSGTLTLSGTNTHSGATTISNGTLLVNGSNANSAVTVSSGATLGGTGTVAATTVSNGGVLTPGVSAAGTLNSAAMTLASGSSLNVDLGTSSDLVAVTGNLSLAGTVNVTAGSGFAPGTYTLFTYTGSLTANTLAVGSLPAGYSGSISVSGGNVNLVLTKSLTISGTFTANNKTYDGATSATINANSLALSGVVGADVVSLTPTLVFSDASVASAKTVSLAGSSLGGANASKYTLSLAGAPTATADITAKTLTISGTFTANNKAYDASTTATINANSLSLVGKVGADVVTLTPALVFSDALVGAGKTVSLTGSSLGGAAAANYTLSLAGAPTTTASITSTTVTITGSFTASSKTYDGTTTATINTNSLSLSGVAGGDVVTLTPALVFSNALVGAGKTVSLTGSTLGGANAANYTLSLSGAPTTTASITAKSLTIGGSFTAQNKAFDNATTATINVNSLSLVGKVGSDVVTLSPTLVFSDAAVGAGKTVSLTGSSIAGADAANYSLSLSGAPTTTASITTKTLTISGTFTASNKTYDGATSATINTNSLSLSGVVGGDVVTLSPTLVFADALVGTGKTVSLTGSSLGGAQAANYTLSLSGAPAATANITAKTLTISGSFTSSNKTYDGATTATISTNSLSLSGVVGADVVALTPALVFADALVGTGKAVSLTGSSISGANASNYTLSLSGAPSSTANITAKSLTIGGSFTANDKAFDNTTVATINNNSLALVGKVGADVVTLSPTLVFSDAAVGVGKTVSLTGSTIGGAAAANYSLSLAGAPTTTATITAKALTISGTFTANDKAYDGSVSASINGNSLSLSGVVGGDAVTLTPALVFADANVGTSKIVSLTGSSLGGADASKYTLSLAGAPTTTAAITAKSLTISGTFTANDKAYDNTTAATINDNSLALVGKVGADVVTLSPTLVFSSAAVGSGKTVSLTGSAIGGAGASNYSLSLAGAPTTTAAITAKSLTISGTFTAGNKTYDGSTSATIGSNILSLSGVVGGTTVTLSPTLVFSDALVGAGKTVSLTGSGLGGADAAMYTLSLVGAPTTTASITVKTLTIGGSFTANDKPYDNTTAATINANSLTLVGKVGADVVTLSPALDFSDAAVGAGKTVSLTGSGIGGAAASNYSLSLAGAPTTTAAITTKTLTISGSFTASDKTYDGNATATINANSLSLTGVVGADVVTLSPTLVFADGSVGSGKAVSLTGSSLAGANASKYTLSLAGAPTTTASITVKALTISGTFTASGKTYDGTTTANIASNGLSLSGVVGGDAVTLTPVLDFATSAAGVGKTASLTGSTLGGAKASEYSLSFAGAPTTTATISVKTVTVGGSFTANNKPFDNNTSATINVNSLTLVGKVGADDLTLSPVLVFADAAVGSGKTVSLTGSVLAGATAANYSLDLSGAPTTTATITSKGVTIGGSFTANGKTYDGTNAATINTNSLTLSGIVGGDIVTLVPNLVFDDAAAGAGKTVSLTGSTLGGANGWEYAIYLAGAPTTTATIAPKTLTVGGSFTANDKPFDNTATASINTNSLTLVGKVGSDDVALTPTVGFADAVVGAGKTVGLTGGSLSGAEAANYTLSVAGAPTATASITTKILTISGTFTANDKTYDGSTSATINVNGLTLEGKVGSDDVTLAPTLVFSNSLVGTGKTVSISGGVLGGADAAKYTLSLAGAPSTSAAITAKTLTVGGSFTAHDKTFDNTDVASIDVNSLTLVGKVGGDVVTLTSVAVFNDALAANGKTVTLMGSAIGGAGVSNYTLSLAGAPTTTASITAKALTISGSFTASNKTYDGAATATINTNGLALSGVLGTDVVNLVPVLGFDDALVGAGKTVGLTGSSLGGANASNYSLDLSGAPTATATITAKTLTIGGSFTASDKAFDNNTSASISVNSLTLVGKVGADVVTLTPAAVFSDAAIGSGKTVSLTGSSIGGAAAGNYSLSLSGAPTTTASITNKTLTVGGSFTVNNKIYDGSTSATMATNSLTLSGVVGGDVVTLSPTLVFSDALVGAGKTVSLTGSVLGGPDASKYTLVLAGAPTSTASITAKTLTVGGSFTANDKPFDNTATATISVNSLTLVGKVGPDVVTLSPVAVFDDASVGNGKIVSLTGSSLGGAAVANYTLSLASAPTTTAAITQKSLTISGAFSAHDKTYDGSSAASINANTLSLTGVVGGDVVTLSPSLTFSDALVGAGKTVSLAGSSLGGADASKYTLSMAGAPTTTASITTKSLTISGSFTANDKTFDKTTTATIAVNSLNLVGKVGADVVTLSPTLVFANAAVGAGKTVSLTGSNLGGANASNYNLDLTGAPTTTASITTKTLTISGSFSANDKTYDGGAIASINVNSLALTGVEGGDVVTLNPVLDFADALVGTGKTVSLSGSGLGGAQAGSYTLSLAGAPTTTAAIAAKTLTVGGSFTANDKAFDNTTTATINNNSLTLVGKVGADVVTLSPTLVFADAAVGSGKIVSLTGSVIGGAGASNYTLSLAGAPTTTASITTKTLTITGSFTANSKAYDGTTSATINSNSLVLSGVVGADAVTLSPVLVFSDAVVGISKTVSLTGSTLGGADATKYTLSMAGAPTATASITASALTIGGSFTANGKTYDGTTLATINANSLTLVGVAGGDVVTLSPVLSYSDEAVGVGKIVGLAGSTLGGADASKYTLSLAGSPTATATIAAKTLTISGNFTVNDKTFDNSSTATINANSLSLVGKVGSDVVALSPVSVFSDAAVGAGKLVTLTGSSIGGANAANYTLTLAGSPTTTASISAKSLTISGTFGASDKTYDGSPNASINANTLSLVGVIGGDVVTLTPVLVFPDALVGSGKVVSLSGSTLGGANASGYSLSLVGAPTSTASITPKSLTISGTMTASDKVYDGTVTASIGTNSLALTGVVGADVVTLAPTLAFADSAVGAGKTVSVSNGILGGANASNYSLSLVGSPTTSASITAKSLTISGTFAANDKAFDNTAVATMKVNSLILVGKVGADVVTLSPTLVFADAQVGTGKVVSLAGSSLGGANAASYSLSLVGAPTTTAAITSKGVTVTGTFTANDKIYDGSTAASINANNLALSGVVGADVVTFNPAAVFSDASAGVGKSVSLGGGTLGGADASKYTLSLVGAPTTTASITTKSVTITPVSGQAKPFGDADPVFNYTNSEWGNNTNLTGALGRTVGTSMGTYAYTLGSLSAGGNYALTLAGGSPTFAITARPITITANAQSKQFGDVAILGTTAYTVTTGSLANSGDITGVSLASSGTADTASIGSYPIQPSAAVGPNVANYSITYANGVLTVGDRPNTAPSFTKGSNQAILENAPAQSVSGWATNLAKGPSNESSQILGFRVSNSNAVLFATQPSISAVGTLAYAPAVNANGLATVYVRLGDDGGTVGGGVDSSAIDSFTITLIAVNQAPSFSKGANQAILENASAQTVAGWATNLSKGPANESSQTLGFRVSNSNAALFGTLPSISSEGELTYAPAANAIGLATVYVRLGDNGDTANGGVDSSAIDSFTITVTAVNQAPSFTKGSNQTILENAAAQTVAGWATNLSKGPANEASQTLGFRVSNSNASLFGTQPAISSAGALTYAPAADANGLATVYVRLGDNGGTANGGGDSSAIDSFTIAVTAVNQAPSFTKGSNQTILENAPAQTVAGWATNLSKGPANESSQTLGFRLSNSNAALFGTQPSISSIGALTYVPATNANGVATVYVRLGDDGGTANGGVDSSAIDSFTIAVTAVNQAPSFTKGANQSVLENVVPQTVTGWAGSISVGAQNEVSQKLSFRVVASPSNLFAVQPAISSTGVLTYAPATNVWGVAKVMVRLGDDGGTANGGVDSSAIDSFTIQIRHNLYPKIKPDTLRLRPKDSVAFTLALRMADGSDSVVALESGTWSWSTNLGALQNGWVSGLSAGTSKVFVTRSGRMDSATLIVQPLDSAFTAGKDTVQVRVSRGVWVTVPPRSANNQITIKAVDTATGIGIAPASVTLKVKIVPRDTTPLALALSTSAVDSKLQTRLGAPMVFAQDSTGKVRVVETTRQDTLLRFGGTSGSSYWLGYDTVPVKISSGLDRDSLARDTSARVDFSLSDNTSDAGAYLCLVLAGQSAPKCSLLVKTDSVKSIYSIPKSAMPLGARVWMEGRDSRSVTATAARDIVVKVDTIKSPVVRQEDRYELLALPYTDGNGSVQDAYKRQFGAVDPTRWRVFRADTGVFREVSSNDSSTDLGKSFWVRTRKTSLTPWVSDVWTVPVSKSVQVSLVPGWNMVGNPYPFDVAWSRVVDSSKFEASSIQGPYSYDPVAKIWSTPDTTRVLKAWKGVAVYNSSSKAVAMSIPGITTASSTAARALAFSNSFRMGIRGWQGSSDTARVWVGIDSSSKSGLDAFDNPLPPVPSKGMNLALSAPFGARATQSYFTDVRPMTDSGVEWSVHLDGIQSDRPLSLGFARAAVDSTVPVWVLDVKSRRWIEASGTMEFAVGKETARDFKVLVGAAPRLRPDMSRFGLASRAHGVAWYIPDGMGRTRVKIDLYDLRGRRLMSFVDEDMDPGIYSRDIAQVFALSRLVVVLDAGGQRKTLGTVLTR